MTESTLRDRARFDALRRRMFGEMGHAAKRWGAFWMSLFGVFVLIWLATHDASPARLALQAFPLTLCLFLLVRGARKGCAIDHEQGLLAGMLLYFASVANTGGCASPFLIMGLPILFGAALLPMHGFGRTVAFAAFAFGFVAISLASRPPTGELAHQVASGVSWSPTVYLLLSTVAVFFVVIKMHHLGKNVSIVYERAALALADSREELCDESQDRTRALEGVAARLAHEIKNPLAAIKGLSAHMARNASDAKMAERLAIVAAEADRLKEIVDGFLSFSRGLDEMQVVAMRPFELARDLAVLLEIRAAEAGVALEVTGSADLQVNADKRKLRQALLNLVLNAVQASPSGQTVRVEVRQGCSGAIVQVIDYGAGMSGEILERIRRPYFTTREGGTGLGVAVARGLVEQHGGQLKYDSTLGKGTTVTIELPWCARKIANERRLPDPTRQVAPLLSAPEGGTS